jgi:putative Mg2+ transporter-C (MgtC) family protein
MGAGIAADPLRIVQAVILAIGFIGGGAILRDEASNSVRNLTTATSLLLTSAVAVSVGFKLYYYSGGLVLIGIFVNGGLLPLEKYLPRRENTAT